MRTRDRPTLMKAYGITNLMSEGFFADVWSIVSDPQEPYIAPWLTDVYTSHSLDRYYYFVHSGDKLTSKLISSQFDEESGISVTQRIIIARAFLDVHGQMLNREWANYVKQYDPLLPYDVTEETDYSHGNTSTIEDDGTVTVTKSGKETNKTLTHTDVDSVYGFDSQENTPVESDQTKYAELETSTTYGGNTQADTRQDTRSLDTVRTTRDNSTDDLTTHKYGTLGTSSMAEIMSQEIKTWMWNFYLKCLFPAADSMLSIPIY